MARIRLSDILNWTKGDLTGYADEISGQTASDLIFSDIITDTRQLVPGCLFIALRGSRFDGHEFVSVALDNGAAAVLTERSARFPGKSVMVKPRIEVDDTLNALQAIAAGYRRQLKGTVIAISGSVGKTTTRELAAVCLRSFFKVHQTSGNLNNEIGLPQTLLRAKPDDDVIILEMGMRAAGEISLLSKIARPDIALLTQIGWSHIEYLGSREAIFKAKAEIIDGLKPDGWLIVNADDPWLRSLAARQKRSYQVAAFSTISENPWPEADLWLYAGTIRQGARQITARASVYQRAARETHEIGNTGPGSRFLDAADTGDPKNKEQNGQSFSLSLPAAGLHLVRNLLAGLAAAVILGIDPEKAAARAAAYRPVGNRQRVIHLKDLTLMDDSYNAAPESMVTALETLAVMADGRHRLIAVLGSMLELGRFARQAHEMVGEAVVKYGYSAVFCLGDLAGDIANKVNQLAPEIHALHDTDKEALQQKLTAWLKPGDYVLIKGSRALAMETITEYLQDKGD